MKGIYSTVKGGSGKGGDAYRSRMKTEFVSWKKVKASGEIEENFSIYD